MREVVLDTETTGLSYKNGDRIIEVGCVELINHISSENKLQFYCSTNKNIDEGATKIHGLTNDFLSNYSSFENQVGSFLDFIQNDTLIIHNAEFDMGFINNELKLLGAEPLKNKIIDTVSLARKTLSTRTANLDYLCKRFSIDLSERNLHGALLDAQLLAEVYLELIGGKQISMNLGDTKEKAKSLKKNNILVTQSIPKVELSKEEVLLHKKLTKEIKNSLWEKIDY